MRALRITTIVAGLCVSSWFAVPATVEAQVPAADTTVRAVEPPGEDAAKRYIYFEKEPIELAMYPDKIAVWFEPGLTVAERTQIRAGHDVFALAELDTAFEPSSTEVYRLSAPRESNDLLEQVRVLRNDPSIKFATPVYFSHGIDLIPTGTLFVQFTPDAALGAVDDVRQDLGLDLHEVTSWREGNYMLRVRPDGLDDSIAACEKILQRDDVEFSEPNFIRLMKRLDVPNDPLFDKQWSLDNTGQAVGHPNTMNGAEDCDADAPEGWCIEKGCNVTIAIIDEGVDTTHADYTYITGQDFVPLLSGNPPDNDPSPSGDDAHGTACAGIAAGMSDNGQGVAGVNWFANIMGVRIAQGLPSGAWWTSTEVLSKGIAWAYQNGADVLSNSWGGGPPSAQILAAIRDALIHGRSGLGSVVAVAAGNDNVFPPIFPGAFDESFCVAATSPCDERKSPSSCDAANCSDCDSCNNRECWGSNYGDEVDVSAPGVFMPTTDISGAAGYCPGVPPGPVSPPPWCPPGPDCTPPPWSDCSAGNDYIMNFNGTSSATPFVAGLAGLVMCKYPAYTALEVQARIEQTCDKVGGYAYSATTGKSFDLGHGRVNIYRAMSGKPQVKLGPLPAFPSVYRDDGDAKPGYPLTHHDSAACEYLGEDYSPEKSDADPDDPDGKKNIAGPAGYNQDAFEKAVTYYPPYIPGQANKVDVTVTVEDSTSSRYVGKNLYVNVWFDWESDDDWNLTYDWMVKNEVVSPSGWGVGVNSKTFTYNFIVPSFDVNWHLQNDNAGQFMHVRTRLSHDQPLANPAMVADFGEVEDDVFLNFVEMFDIGVGYMNITSGGCENWLWLDDQMFLNDTCHPPFMPDGPPANGYVTAEVYLDFSGSGFDTGLRTPSFDLTELTEAFVEYDFSAVEPVTGYVYLYKNGILDATLKVYPMSPLALCNVFHEKIDISAWCGDGNDDIMIEFHDYTPPCDPFEYQDWKLDNIVVWGDDIIDPATTPVNTNPLSMTSNQIDWITPGDDGNIRQAETYNVRYGPKPITAANWKHALWLRKEMVTALPVPQMPGVQENVTVSALSAGLHHFALMTMDEVTNKSGVGPGGANNPPVQTAPATVNATEGDLITFSVTATDPDFDPLLMYATAMPTPTCNPAVSCMTYIDNGNNTATFTWQTQSGDQGNHVLIVRAKDPNNLTDTDGVSINVSAQPAATGACCIGGNCQIATAAVCNALNGTYQGNGTTCNPNPCATPAFGACCDPNGSCSVVTQSTCAAIGGTYQGNGTTCTPTTCSPGTCIGLCPTDLTWSLAATNTPNPRWGHAMTYDPVRDRTVLFGGLNGNETWEWDGTSWTQHFPATLPPGRTRPRLAFDSANGVTVLFGGQDATNFFGDTWTWDGNNWQQVFSAVSPSPRASFAMVSDTVRHRIVLYGGLDAAGNNLSDTWEFDGSAWAQVFPPVSPGTLHSHAMTYDSTRRVTVLYGGAPGFGGSDQTWEYDGSNWTQRFPATNPGMRNGHKMTYDSRRMVTVLYGGNNFTTNTDIWEWDGGDWVDIAKNAPGSRNEHAMAYHESKGEVVLFGGVTTGSMNADTWVYPGASVTQTYVIFGTATGIGWSWNVFGPTVDMCDLSVPGAPTGSPAIVLAELFATSIDNAGCGGLSATAVGLTPFVALLSVTVGNTSSFDLCVGDFGLMPGCCVAAAGGCSFNPDIFEIHLSGEDCNANAIDDAIDLAIGTSDDVNANGIPDECEPWICASDADCDDGVFCNGVETCLAGACLQGNDPCAAGEQCDEAAMSCTVVDAIMTLAPSSTIAQPGGSIQLDVLLESVIDLRAYQVEIEITQLSGSGTVEVTCPGGVEMDMARADYVFAGQSGVLPVVSCPFMRFGAALLQGGVDVAGPAYLGHLVLDVSGSATPGSTFEISIAADPLSFLRDSNSGAIPMAIGSSFILTIADTVMTCRLTSDTVAPGGSVDLELYLGDVNDLRAYQGTIEIRPLTGAGSVDVTCPDGVEVDATRPDYVFAGPAPVVPEMDCPNLRLGSAFVFASDAVDVIGPKYLGHYTLDVSADAVEGSTFEIAILPDPDSFLRDASGQPQAIPMGLSMPCRLTIASCGPPTVTAVGPRYVEIVPPAVAGNVALRVTSLDEPCVDAYVDFDPDPSLAALGIARLVAAPVFRAPADWGVVYLGDEEILPDTEYTVRTVCATGSESAGESATAWLWGDVDDSGGSDFDDILCILDAFAGNFANCSLYGVDLRGDVPNGVTDFDDVLAGLNAFSGNPYPGIDPCPGP